jgi:hypothetical protein
MTTGAKHEERVAAALAELRELRAHGEIVEILARRFKVSERQARSYVAVARERLAEDTAETMPGLRDGIFRELLGIYREAKTDGDTRLALATLAKLGDMFGVDAPQRVELSGNVGISIGEMRPEDVIARIMELLEKHADKLPGAMSLLARHRSEGVAR